MTANPEALRADARRNRAQILAAAKTVFAQQGPEAPVEEIAKAARVGVGTLYRRFPDREALIQAVGRENLTNALTEAKAAVAEESTAWDALVRLLQRALEMHQSVQLTMASEVARAALLNDPLARELRAEMLDVLDGVIRAAQEEGSLRSDIGPGDLTMVFVTLLKRVSLPRAESMPIAAQRCMAIMLDGLRARPGQSLPGAPLSRSDLGF